MTLTTCVNANVNSEWSYTSTPSLYTGTLIHVVLEMHFASAILSFELLWAQQTRNLLSFHIIDCIL